MIRKCFRYNVVEGTQAGATAYSITVTDKVNNLKTYLYVEYLLTELPEKVSKKKDSTFFLGDFMSWSLKTPTSCRKIK